MRSRRFLESQSEKMSSRRLPPEARRANWKVVKTNIGFVAQALGSERSDGV